MKNRKLGYAIIAIAFALFNVISFSVPTQTTSTFWIAYIFTGIAFISQIIIWMVAFKNANTLKSKFLGFPIVYIGIVYLIIQVITFLIFIAVPTLSPWIAAITCSLILGISYIFMITTEVGRDEIKRVDVIVQQKTLFIKMIQTDIELLANSEKDASKKKLLTRLGETVRYSDPMTDDSLMEIENKITEEIIELKTSSDREPIINEIDALLVERNQKCKMLK